MAKGDAFSFTQGNCERANYSCERHVPLYNRGHVFDIKNQLGKYCFITDSVIVTG